MHNSKAEASAAILTAGKRRVTRSIPDWRTLVVDSLLFRPNKPGWL